MMLMSALLVLILILLGISKCWNDRLLLFSQLRYIFYSESDSDSDSDDDEDDEDELQIELGKNQSRESGCRGKA